MIDTIWVGHVDLVMTVKHYILMALVASSYASYVHLANS